MVDATLLPHRGFVAVEYDGWRSRYLFRHRVSGEVVELPIRPNPWELSLDGEGFGIVTSSNDELDVDELFRQGVYTHAVKGYVLQTEGGAVVSLLRLQQQHQLWNAHIQVGATCRLVWRGTS